MALVKFAARPESIWDSTGVNQDKLVVYGGYVANESEEADADAAVEIRSTADEQVDELSQGIVPHISITRTCF